MRVFSWLGALVLLVGGLSGCQQAQEPSRQAAPPRLTGQELTMAQNGGSVTLKVGQQVALALPGSPQSGYQWQVEKAPTNLLRKQASSFEPAPKSEVCGMQHLQFAAQQTGRGLLTLAYRPTEGAEDVANYYTLHLNVVR